VGALVGPGRAPPGDPPGKHRGAAELLAGQQARRGLAEHDSVLLGRRYAIMKRRFSLFTYPVMDMKAAEAELNRRAAAGWRLERIWLDGLACFVPAEEPVCYCLDWCDPVLAADAPDYRALLAEAGWTRRALVGSWA